MTHLHLADGILPVWLWLSGLVAAGIGVGLVAYGHRGDRADRLTLLGALGALMLAASAVPIGPIGHLSFAPVVGILLGPGLGFVAATLVNATLALLGHGGITVVGLNACVLGAGTAVARPAYRLFLRRAPAGRAAAFAAVVSVLVSIAVLSLVLVLAGPLTGSPGSHDAHGAHGLLEAASSTGRFALFSSPFWLLGLVAESLVTASVISFLARVRPELLPVPGGAPLGAPVRVP
ncbi:MAG: energy-coupling factor ABC transporter permease [Candidatus Eiseniibacteriota bacterium]